MHQRKIFPDLNSLGENSDNSENDSGYESDEYVLQPVRLPYGELTNEYDTNTNSEEITPEEKHIAYFANKDGWVSRESMRNKFRELKDDENAASYKSNVVSAVGGLKTHYCPFRMFTPKEAVGTLNHPRDSGIYQSDGKINETVWKYLLAFAQNEQGQDFITQAKLKQFLQWRRDSDDRWDWLGLGKSASDAEWEDLFSKCTDYWMQTEKGPQPAITIARLRQFFEDSKIVLDEVVAGTLPSARPR